MALNEHDAVVRKHDLVPYAAAGYTNLIALNQWNYTDSRGRERGKSPLYNNWPRQPECSQDEIAAHVDEGRNIGVRLRATDFIIDYDPRNDEDGSGWAAFVMEVGQDWIDSCPRVNTGGGGQHYYATKPESIRIRERVKAFGRGVEFKTKGRQVVAAGSKHPNGVYYEWDDIAPPLKDVPEAAEPLLALICRATIDPSTQSEPGQIDNDELAALLASLDPEGLPYDDWLEIGMSSYHATNGDGLEAFTEWSVSDGEYSGHEESIQDHWESFAVESGEPAVTIGTLLMHVHDAGGETNWLALALLDDADDIELPIEAKEYEKAVKADRKRKLNSVVTLANVKPKRVDWLVPYWIPARMLTLFTGNPAVLKSTVAIDIVARITRGDPMPFCNKGTPPGDVLILACEDPVPEVVVPRLLIAGADMSRVHVRQAAWAIDQLGELEDMVEKFKPKLIYIDALFSALQNMDAHRDNEVRGPLISMTALAAKHGATILATRHTRKGGASLAIDAGMASRAFGAVARSEILFVSDPDAPQDAGRFIMAHAKCNLKPRQTSQRYQAEEAEVPDLPGEHSVRVKWLGASQYTADQLASGEANDQGRAQRDAQVWLEDYLREHGPTRPRDLGIEAEEAGHNRRTLFRAVEASASIRGEGQGPARVWVYDRHAILGDNA